MANLHKFKAFVCPTAAGILIHQTKVLLVLHKKLGIWLPPGGHIDEGELPHAAAEREFFEETGVKVKAISAYPLIKSDQSEYLPTPLAVNLHWISQTNYRSRLSSRLPTKRHVTSKFPLGCEQHYTLVYLVKPVDQVKYRQNIEETNDIGWFTPTQIKSLETTPDIKQELELTFKLLQQTEIISSK